MKQETLLEKYDKALEEFKQTGYHLHPANLLAMLLLSEKDTFEPLLVCEGEFYKRYKNKIDIKINKVISDFKISREEILAFIEQKGIISEDFEEDKIWFVFAEGFGNMHGEMMYRPNQTAYQIYNYMDNKLKLYRMTECGLEEKRINKGQKVLYKNSILACIGSFQK